MKGFFMDFTEFESLLADNCQKNRVEPPTKEQIDLFWRFTDHLLNVNAVTNLTAIRSVPDIIVKHYVDSLTVASLIPENQRVLDLGCGPGFPSIPLAIYRPDLTIVGLDSTDKKIRFVNESAQLLGLTNLKGVSGRAEDAKIRKELQTFDIVVSRAVSRLNILDELCIPYLRVCGKLIAMKGAKGEEELSEAQKGIGILGGKAKKAHNFFLIDQDGNKEARCLIEIEKIKETPAAYPRAYATIQKKPL